MIVSDTVFYKIKFINRITEIDGTADGSVFIVYQIILSGTVLGPLDEFGYGEILYSVISEAVTRTGDGSYPTEKSLLKKLKERGTALEFAINVLSDKALENNANP